MNTENQLDIRSIKPSERHPKIFKALGDLTVGNGFMLINDHDPRPLYIQMNREYPGQFSWEYKEQGPATWQVEIKRLKEKEKSDSCCGGGCGG